MTNDSKSADDDTELLEQGRAHLKAGRQADALEIADHLLKTFEETPATLLFAGEVHFARAGFVEADRLAKRCSEAFPDDYGGPVLRCRTLCALGKLGEARELALSMADKDLTLDSHIEIVVTILSGCTEPEAAYPLCKRAIALDPYEASAHRRLALVCRLIGKMDEAEKAANIALRFDPHDYEMIGLRSDLRKATPEKNYTAELEALLAKGCKDWRGATRVAFSLAKEKEDLGEHWQAFEFLKFGASHRRQNTNYRVANDIQTINAMQEVFTEEAMAAKKDGFDSEEPIFILGMPRTGSTLVERIISCHSAVFAAGELNHFSAAMMEEVRKLGRPGDRAELVRMSLQADMNAIGRCYLKLTRPFTGHTPHFIDKLPLNFLSLGVIHLALPKASIIHIRRTPMDACFAVYKFLFGEAYAWSYDLDDIAAYYIGYRQLMDHWRTTLPGRIIDVAYEDVVDDLEREAKSLIVGLGLEWEPACLEFHESTAPTMTGSATQVRQKLYSSSVGRWRDYEAQLQPLAKALEAAGIDPFNP